MTRPHTFRRTLIALALALPAWLACTDAPSGPSQAESRGASAASRASAARATGIWQQRAGEIVASHSGSPIVAGRVYALLGMAQYGAIVDADFGGGQAQFEARRGAVAGASAQLLSALYPDVAASLEQLVIDQGAAGNGGVHPHFTRGVAAGRAAGDVMKAWAATDGFALPWNRVPLPTGPGLWRQAPNVAPAGFQLPQMRPYVLASPSELRSVPPPAFGSPEFLAALAFVRHTTDNRTPAQAGIANFWNQSTGTPTTAAFWIARGVALAEARGLDERETAHLVAVTSVAIMDAAIGCFDAKYHYQYIRPTQADPLITQPAGPPGFPYGVPNHPSYPSGHSCLSGAAVSVLEAWFPEETATLDAQMFEAGMSRIYGGLHYMFDVTAGQTLGRGAAAKAIAYDRQFGLLHAVMPQP